MKDDLLDTAAAELENSIKEDEQSAKVEPKDLGKAIVEGVQTAVKDFLAKGKGAQTSDLSAEKDKRGELTGSGKDPAESPKKSGQGYSDSSGYEARKGDDSDDDDDDSDDVPAFFKKKKKGKKVKKSDDVEDDSDEDSDDEAYDATEFVEEMGDAVNHMNKSINRLEEGLAVFGELLAEVADARRDKLMVNMAKALTHIVEEQKEIKKSLVAHSTMMKSIAQLPGMPRVAGLFNQAQGTEEVTTSSEGAGTKLSKATHDRLWQMAVQRKITSEEMKKAIQMARGGDDSFANELLGRKH